MDKLTFDQTGAYVLPKKDPREKFPCGQRVSVEWAQWNGNCYELQWRKGTVVEGKAADGDLVRVKFDQPIDVFRSVTVSPRQCRLLKPAKKKRRRIWVREIDLIDGRLPDYIACSKGPMAMASIEFVEVKRRG